MAAATLELVSDAPDRTHRLLAEGLGLTGRNGCYPLGPLDLRLLPAGSGVPAGPGRLLLHCDDPDDLARRLPGSERPASTDAPEAELHGVRLGLVPRTGAEPSAALPENVLGPDHVGVATDASEPLARALCEHLGFERESRQIDTQLTVPMEVFSSDRHGVVSHSGTPQPAGALLVTFLRREGVDLELLEDIVTGAAPGGDGPGSTSGDNRAISRFVARRGPGLHHLAVRVADIRAGIDRIVAAGVRMLDDRGRPGSRAGQIAFADRRATGGLVVHLVQRP